jgi:tetratricopeptide (TPR) repeat protein
MATTSFVPRINGVAPDNAAILSVLAEAHFAAGDLDAAIKWNEKALEIQPTSITIGKQAERFKKASK